MTWVAVVLVGVAGFLLGGVYASWRTSRLFAGVLGVAAALALAGAVAWVV